MYGVPLTVHGGNEVLLMRQLSAAEQKVNVSFQLNFQMILVDLNFLNDKL